MGGSQLETHFRRRHFTGKILIISQKGLLDSYNVNTPGANLNRKSSQILKFPTVSRGHILTKIKFTLISRNMHRRENGEYHRVG